MNHRVARYCIYLSWASLPLLISTLTYDIGGSIHSAGMPIIKCKSYLELLMVITVSLTFAYTLIRKTAH